MLDREDRMIDPAMLKAVADYAARVIGAVVNADTATRTRWKTAVEQLQDSVLQTQLYVSTLDRAQLPDRTVEERLVGLWRVAATAFYGLDGALAERLQLKAEYWTQPDLWSAQQVRDAGIALEHVAQLTRQLLREGK